MNLIFIDHSSNATGRTRLRLLTHEGFGQRFNISLVLLRYSVIDTIYAFVPWYLADVA